MAVSASAPTLARARRPAAIALAALVVVTVGVACGQERRGGDECRPDEACAAPPTEVGTAESATVVDLQLRPVLSEAAPPTDPSTPCPTATALSRDAIVEVPSCLDGTVDATYSLAPVALDGSAFESARAIEDRAADVWVVNPVLKQGRDGIDLFNAVAARCYALDSTCPTGQLAIVADGVVVSAPSIVAPRFEADQIQIGGTPFTEAEATALAAGIDAAG